MQENMNATLDLIIRWEGNDVNTAPSEPGGISKYGISLTAYSDYCKKMGKNPPVKDDVANLTEADARIFYEIYWLPQVRFRELPVGVDMRLADISVNSGIVGACKKLEMVLLQFPLTGKISDDLLKILNSYDPKMVVFALGAAWISAKETKPTWYDAGGGKSYGHGWSNRNIDVTQKSLGLIK